MTNALVVLNAGSSSIKFSVFKARDFSPLLSGQIEGLYNDPHCLIRGADGAVLLEHTWAPGQPLGHEHGVAYLLEQLPGYLAEHRIVGVGHRIVHGGTEFAQPVRLTEDVLSKLDKLVPLAPLHQPHNIAPVRALFKLMPGLPQVGCFDTAFHVTAPMVEQMFALPRELHDAGVRRYGFHGLSYEYIASQLPKLDERVARGKTVVLHLGNGSSMCALDAGVSVGSTMGFTALDGLPMGTRCGSMDPGVIIWLMDQRGMGPREIEKLLYSKSGLLGVSGLSSDMRTLLASDDPQASLAVDLYVYRITRELGSLAAALRGLDALVFTAGIGEHAPQIRERVCREAAWFGIEIDDMADRLGGPLISTSTSKVSVWVVPTNEELMIARHTAALVPV